MNRCPMATPDYLRYKPPVAIPHVQTAAGANPACEVEIEVLGSALGAHPGAEVVGVVRSAGESAQHLLGRTVLVPRVLGCGECELCRRGRLGSCAALFARPRRPQKVERLPARFLLPLEPPYMAAKPAAAALPLYAALSDGILAPYSGLVRAGVGPGMLCLILGSGSRLALATVAARALGAQVALLSDDAEEQALLCEPPYRALRGFDGSKLELAAVSAALLRLCDEAGLPWHGLCVLETSGSEAGRTRALTMLGAGGTAVLLERAQPLDAPLYPAPALPVAGAGPTSGISLLEKAVSEGCQIIGAGTPHPDLLPELVALIERAQLEPELSTLTRAITPTEIDAVMAARRSGHASAAERIRLPIVAYPPAPEPVEAYALGTAA